MPDVEVNDITVASELIENEKRATETLKNVDYPDNPEPESSQRPDKPTDEWLDVLGSGDLKIKTLREGTPNTRPLNADIAVIKLEVTLENGEIVEKNDSLEVEVSASEVVQGLDLILPLVDVGQQVTAIVKPRFAYGTLGLLPKIAPNTTLIYNVELLNVLYAPQLTAVPYEDRKKKALFKKEKGNWWYSRGDASKAIQCYRAALDVLQDSTPYIADNVKTEMPEDVFREMVQQKLVIYNNLAAAQLMVKAYDSALMSVDSVIELEPNNVKALFRKGKILLAKGNTDEAVNVLTKVAALEPENNAVKKELSAAKKRQAKEKLQTKSLYQKMMGTERITEPNDQVPPPPKEGISLWTKVLAATACATIAAVVAYSSKSKGFPFWD